MLKLKNFRKKYVSKELGQEHLHHCVVTSHFLLITLSKHLGTEDTSC